MSMNHKAFAFDWEGFHKELLPILKQALRSHSLNILLAYIEENISYLRDPYEGISLSKEWKKSFINNDIHEYGDYALTKFYNPTQNYGIGDAYISIERMLLQPARQALLGNSIEVNGIHFDPGRMGSYFQSSQQVFLSLKMLSKYTLKELAQYKQLLQNCIRKGYGIYITF